MAYRRKYGSSKARKPTRSSGRRSRYTAKTPRYRRTTRRTYPRRIPTKSILNKTSTKKRDTMLSFSNTGSTGNSQTVAASSFTVSGNSLGYSLWCPTARDLYTTTGGNLRFKESLRTSTTCFMRGLSEKIRVQSSSGLPWMWRRICFAIRGQYFLSPSTATQVYRPYAESSAGFVRQWFNILINNDTLTSAQLNALLFKGQAGQDWNDFIIAPIDTRRVDLKFDKTWKLHSGNQSGVFTEKNLWHPMNKNLNYDDDENGTEMTDQFYSVDDKRGMGDYYVVDIVVPGKGGSATDIIDISSTASLYWHEK